MLNIQTIMPNAFCIARCVGVLAAAVFSMTGASAASAEQNAEQITIARLSGSVQLSENGKSIAPRLGLKLSSPLRVQTGNDGNVRLEHSGTSLDIGPDSTVVIPRGQQNASALEKIQQELGRVLYSVKPRKARPLVVETPYLVSVVKGTTFSVAVDESSASVALLEGSLQISGPGVDRDVLLEPNQTATRERDSRSIEVTTIPTSAPPLPPQAAVPSSPLTTASSIELAGSVEPQGMQTQDLAAITAANVERRVPVPQPQPQPQPQPDPVPVPQPQPDPAPAPQPEPDPEPEPEPDVPSQPPSPQPEPDPTPMPDEDDHGHHDDDDDDDDHGGDGDDDDDRDDGNNGHGDDDGDSDGSNPGHNKDR